MGKRERRDDGEAEEEKEKERERGGGRGTPLPHLPLFPHASGYPGNIQIGDSN